MARILLIDDDELLRDALLQLLQLDGHRVVDVADGDSGLRLFRDGSAFDIVVTDILMPGTDGTHVIVEIQRRRPGFPIIAISGGRRVLSPQFNLGTASLLGAACLLAKPFTRLQLQQALMQVGFAEERA